MQLFSPKGGEAYVLPIKWDECFHYPLFIVLHFVKYVWNVDIFHWEPKTNQLHFQLMASEANSV